MLVQGAPLALASAVRHLLENAAAFSSREGRAEATLIADGPEARFTVADDGPGIAPAEQAQIFERFYQVSQGLSRGHGGLGIGLAIVAKAVDRMGGRVSVDSVVGRGSTFCIELPAAQ